MTYGELKNATALLGFTTSLDEISDTAEAAFRAALSRALWQADALRPRIGTLFLTHRPDVNLADTPHFTLSAGAPVILRCPHAVAYWFEGCGQGSCEVHSGGGVTRLDWDKESGRRSFWGIVEGALEMRFSTETAGSVQDLGLYAGERGIPIPHGGGAYVAYPLTDRAADLLTLSEPPAVWRGDHYETLTDGYYVEPNGRLYLARNRPGSYRVRYRRAAPALPADAAEDTEIPLDGDVAELLPLLIAYYLLLDEEPEKATAYLTLYREGSQLVHRATVAAAPVGYRNTNGW